MSSFSANGPLVNKTRAVRQILRDWFLRHQRDLPWRRSRDPYAIWISEIMLQQTRVDTVIPYYERFLAAFPDVESLANASIDDVLRLWSGLGYYQRARNLHRAAHILMEQHDGRFPQQPAVVRTLPGIGDYTAGAICSLAFDQTCAIVDGNVLRVLSRLFDFREYAEDPVLRRKVWSVAEVWADTQGSGEANQALMEHGALTCTKNKPSCHRCCVRHLCLARSKERQHEIPYRRRKTVRTYIGLAACLLRHSGRLLLVRRQSGRLMQNLWEIPTLEAGPRSRQNALANALSKRLGLATELRPVGKLRHGIMEFHIEAEIYQAARHSRLPAKSRRSRLADSRIANLQRDDLEMRWVPSWQVRSLALTALTKKSLQLASRHDDTWLAYLKSGEGD